MFILVLGGTEVIKHAGISAAGASQELLAYTAALDAEYIVHGKTLTLESLPVSPLGIVSPAAITKTCLDKLGIKPIIVNAGAPIKPQVDCIDLSTVPACSPETGRAIEIAEVERLYQAGKSLIDVILSREATKGSLSGEPCDKETSPLIIAECVVGGTTTAQGLLRALGYEVNGLMSSSIPNGNHALKYELVERGYQAALRREDFSPESVQSNPLLAVSAMGDPMQAVVAGMAVACLEEDIPFWLAGGSQMIAVASLVEKLCAVARHCEPQAKHSKNDPGGSFLRFQPRVQDDFELTIATTHWVTSDKSARIDELLKLTTNKTKLINPLNFGPLPDFVATDKAFQAYEEGHVKEGVGAGALLTKISRDSVIQFSD